MRPAFPRSLAVVPHTSGLFALTLAALIPAALMLPNRAPAEIAVVAARTFNDYARVQLADGSFQRETYTFANAGRWDTPVAGDSIEKLAFMDIAKTIARPLAQRGYVASGDPEKTDLLIFVAWGTTQGTERLGSPDSMQHFGNALNRLPSPDGVYSNQPFNPSAPPLASDQQGQIDTAFTRVAMDALEGSIIQLMAENRWREKANERNADMLGYQYDLQRAYVTNFTTAARDIVDEIEESRYFVVLKAYDFRTAWKEKKRKVLWETRFSIRRHGNDFSEQLAAMTQQASRYFGLHTRGVVREFLPDVKVTLGESRIVEEKSDK